MTSRTTTARLLYHHGVWALARALAVAFLATAAPVPAGAADPPAAGPTFEALLVDGRTLSGRIVEFGPGTIALGPRDGAKEVVPLERLVHLTREGAATAPDWEDAQAVVLPDGDRLMRAAIGSSKEDKLEVRSESLGKLELPIDGVLGLVLATDGPPGSFDARWDRILVEPRRSEVVWLANGDRAEGSFVGIDGRDLKIQVDGKPTTIERSGAAALGFDPKLVNYPRPDGPFLELLLNDGTRVGATAARLDDATIEATTRFGARVQFPIGELARVVARTSSVVYLAERSPLRAAYVPYVGPTRPFRTDRTVDGHGFRLAGRAHDRGIGVQSRTLLAYRIEPGDRRFQALVGVDERAGPLGSVVFRVLIDGQERFRSGAKTSQGPPQAVDVALEGGKVLILDTGFGPRGGVRDLADWVDARIVR